MDKQQQLAAAAEAGDEAAVREILASDPALARGYAKDGWSMLHVAATPSVANLLLGAGADINASNRHKVLGPGNKPLHSAVYMNRPELVEFLLDRGADVNATDRAGWTPLHMAVANGHPHLARRLLEAGANPNVRIGLVEGQEWSNKTPLELLTVQNRTGEGASQVPAAVDRETRQLLIEHGATSG
jgi:ankyrin repeat protein